MGEVARIVVPQPPALMPVEGGMETRGHAYSLHVPANATGPIAVQAATGEVLLFAATEHYYRDANGEWDVIYGAFPAEPITSGQQVRYEGPYPITDEVLRLEPERVKHVSVIYERPRRPGAHLGAGVEFGISWLVSGVALPLGRHQAIEAGPFTLPRPWVSDATGERLYGYYEVVEVEDGLQQLFAWFGADWIMSEERIYPLSVDPTVVVGTAGRAPGFVRLSSGRWVILYINGNGHLAARYSDDHGASWHDIAGPGPGGAISTDVNGIEWADVDAFDRIHITWSKAPNGTEGGWHYAWVRLNGTSAICVQTQIAAQTNPSYPYLKIQARVQNVGSDGLVNIVFAYSRAADGSNPNVNLSDRLYVRSGKSNPETGLLTLENQYNIASQSPYNSNNAAFLTWGLCRAADGTVGILFNHGSYQTFYTYSAKLEAPLTSVRKVNLEYDYMMDGFIGIDGAESLYWIARTYGTDVHIFSATSAYYARNVATTGDFSGGYDGLADLEGKRLFLIGRRSSAPNTATLKIFDQTTKQVTDMGAWGGAAINWLSLRVLKYFDGTRIPIAFASGSTIVQETFSFNSPPLAPSNLTRGPFDATNPAQFTWQYNDPDPNDEQSGYQLQIVQGGVTVVDTGWVQSTAKSYTLPANTLTNGQQYQWRVRTKDQAGLESPWSDYAVFTTSAKPIPSPIYPTTGSIVPGADVVVQWSVASQSSAIVRLYDEDGGSPLQEHTVTGANVRQLSLTGLQNGGRYRWSVQVTSAGGVQGDEVFSGVFDVAYTPPRPAMDVIAAGEAALAAVKLRWRRGFSRPGTFARSSPAYLPDGTEVPTGQPRYYGGGIIVEEFSPNLLTANQSSVETDTTGFFALNGAIIERTTEEAWHGSASLKVTCPGADAAERVIVTAAVAANTAYTASTYIKGPAGKQVLLLLREKDAGNNIIGETTQWVLLTGSWQRVWVTRAFGADGVNMEFHVRNGVAEPKVFYVDGLKLEPKAYPTSWTPGGTTRAVETLTVPTTGWTKGDWQVSIDWTPPVNQDVPASLRYLWRLYIDPYNFYTLHVHPTGRPYLAVVSAGNEANTYSPSDPVLQAGVTYRFTARGDGENIALFINGVLSAAGERAYTEPSGQIPSVMYVGTSQTGGGPPNGIYGPLHISRAMTDQEIAEEFAHGMRWTDKTIALHTWANTLEGGTQESIFANWGVERSEDGIRWVRIAVVDNPDSGDWVEYSDRAVGSGRPYQYRVVAYGSNGTETPGETVSAGVTYEEWRFTPVDGQPEIRFRFDSSVTWRPDEDVQVPRTMSRYRRTYRNPSFARVADIQARFRDGEDGLTVREQRERLLQYIEQGVVGWLRGPHGDVWRGVLMQPQVQPSAHFAREAVSCVFRETREAP